MVAPPEIVTGKESPVDVLVDLLPELKTHLGANVSISLLYYQKKPECWSDWRTQELKGFSKVIEQLRIQTADQLRGRGSAGSPKCKPHKGEVATSGFVRPNISEDISFYEIHVTDKARVHGFFIGPVFFLVWLDRNHRAFK